MINYEKLMAEAREKNQKFDQIDRSRGIPTPKESGLVLWLSTAIEAIECGVRSNDLACICQGQVLLLEIQDSLINDDSLVKAGVAMYKLGKTMARINCQEDRATGTTTNREESDRHDRISI